MAEINWLNDASGNFTDASDWNGGVVPGSSDDAILDASGATPYTVTISNGVTVASIETAANATLSVSGSAAKFAATYGTDGGVNAGTISVSNLGTITLDGMVDNSGTIELAGSHGGVESTGMIVGSAGLTLTGGGSLTFQESGHYDQAYIRGGAFTNVDNQIVGSGIVIDTSNVTNGESASIFQNPSIFGNKGSVYADTISNSGTIECSSSSLSLAAQTINNAGGAILATNGADVLILGTNGVLIGGVLDTADGGVIYAAYSDNGHYAESAFDGTINAIFNEGSLVVAERDCVVLQGTLDNTGSISLTAGEFDAQLKVGAAGATLAGDGIVTLGSGGQSIITAKAAGAALVNVGNTIEGIGTVGLIGSQGEALALVNQAAGVIDATGSLTLDTGGPSIANAGLIEATGSGALLVQGTTIDGSGGGTLSVGAGARVLLEGADLFGGTLTSAGTGAIKTIGGTNVLDGTTAAVTSEATLAVGDDTSLTIQGVIDNSGQINVRSTGDATTLTIGAAGATLSGSGQLSLSNNADNEITGASSAATLTNVANTISGAGTISAILVNEAAGVIEGQFTTGLMINSGANTISNAGLIEAVDGGSVSVESALANTGTVLVTNGTLTLAGAVTGGGVAQIKGGVLDASGAFDENVAFTGGTGALKLADSQGYTSGTISGFSKTGGTSLDLQDIGFTSGVTTATFSGTSTSGVLTVTNGTQTAEINLTGDYLASAFTTSSDGHGGTTVVDPTGRAAIQHFIEAAARMAPATVASATPTGEARDAVAPILARPGAALA